MALTKVITGVTDLNQAQSTNGLKFPTGSVFAGTPEEGMIRNDQSQSSAASSSTMQFYNGTAWKNFVNKVPCTTDNAAYPVTNTAYYKLNNNANDSSGNGYNGTASNVTYAAGKFDDAAVFNGTSSKIDTNTAFTSLVGSSTSYTISSWIYPTSNSTGRPFGAENYNDGIGVQTSNGNIRAQGGNGTWVTTNYYACAINQWHHICLVITTNSSIKLYVDNVLKETLSLTISFSGAARLFLGADFHSSTLEGPFTGSIDQVRIFSSALNAAQVTQLYNEIQC